MRPPRPRGLLTWDHTRKVWHLDYTVNHQARWFESRDRAAIDQAATRLHLEVLQLSRPAPAPARPGRVLPDRTTVGMRATFPSRRSRTAAGIR